MRFKPITYMEWVKTQGEEFLDGCLNLASSNMPTPFSSFEEMGIDCSKMPLGGDNSYGYKPIIEGIAQRYSVDPSQVYPTNGTSLANFLLLSSLTEHGDSILVETPVYDCLTGPSEALGLEIIPIHRKEDNQWLFDIDEAADLVKRFNAKGIFISNPHNPTGHFIDDGTMLALAKKIGEDKFLIVDEVYREWTDGRACQTIGQKAPNIYATSSLTKVWGFGSFRAGWLIASKEITRRASRANDHLGVVAPVQSDWIISQIWEKEGLLDEVRDLQVSSINSSRKEVDKFLESDIGKMMITSAPSSGAIGFGRVSDLCGDDVARRWRDEIKVGVIPGKFFGDSRFVRVSWTNEPKIVREGLSRIQQWGRKELL